MLVRAVAAVSAVQLGPSHPLYGRDEPIGPASTATGRPSTGRPPRPMPASTTAPEVNQSPGRERYSVARLLVEFVREHCRRQSVACPCLLCVDARYHLEAAQKRKRAKGGAL